MKRDYEPWKIYIVVFPLPGNAHLAPTPSSIKVRNVRKAINKNPNFSEVRDPLFCIFAVAKRGNIVLKLEVKLSSKS